jgi:hypothetical protein
MGPVLRQITHTGTNNWLMSHVKKVIFSHTLSNLVMESRLSQPTSIKTHYFINPVVDISKISQARGISANVKRRKEGGVGAGKIYIQQAKKGNERCLSIRSTRGRGGGWFSDR